jgi:biotin carboxyl carrier protein
MIPIPSCTVVTSPIDGRVRRLAADGVEVHAGDVVAAVEGRGRTVNLTTPRAGRIAGALAALAESVAAGEPVVWLART